MAERADLIVVGAGPGGSATAYHAARAGLSVLLLDRQEFPRDKPCGDGLMPHAASEVALMGLADWLEEPHHGKFSGFNIYTRTALLRQGVPPTLHGPHGYVVAREETDAKLLERAREAGADFRGGVRATELLRSPSGETTGVEAVSDGEALTYEAPLVVAADGVGGFAGEGVKAHQNAVARRQYFKNVSGPEQEQRDSQMRTAMKFELDQACLEKSPGLGQLNEGNANQWADKQKNIEQFSYDADAAADFWLAENGEILYN